MIVTYVRYAMYNVLSDFRVVSATYDRVTPKLQDKASDNQYKIKRLGKCARGIVPASTKSYDELSTDNHWD